MVFMTHLPDSEDQRMNLQHRENHTFQTTRISTATNKQFLFANSRCLYKSHQSGIGRLKKMET
jgi:hypothetical protein